MTTKIRKPITWFTYPSIRDWGGMGAFGNPYFWRQWANYIFTDQWVRDIHQIYHRARYGWAPRDVWNFDQYLDAVIGQGLIHLADKSCGTPYPYPFTNPDDVPTNYEMTDDIHDLYRSDINRMGQAFLENTEDDYFERFPYDYSAWHTEETRRRDARNAALKELMPWWDSLWW